ncbi:MAG: hypothetical protein AB7S26_27835 [Sandaracinaceae bacterium]
MSISRPPPRFGLILALALGVGGALALAVPRTEPAQAQAAGAPRMRVAPSRLIAHEWGVWLVQQNRVTHLADLAAESPSFVYRAPGAMGGNAPVAPAPTPNVSRKPVIFLRSDRPMRVSVSVAFTGGEAWLYYPDAAVSARDAVRPLGLTFSGQLGGSGNPLAPAPATSFWHDLRRAGGQVFTTDRGTSEQFLFYDGPVRFERSFEIVRDGTGARVSPISSETHLWLIQNGRFVENTVQGTSATQVTANGDMAQLRVRLNAELQARGLTGPEAHALLETWRDSLFNAPQGRAVYFVPRDAYDRMLPITISPSPSELVRVGLAIEDV